MQWRLANSLATLQRQINSAWPNRSRVSDGTIGDAAHRATKSEHNPNPQGVVTAMDITHDPGAGADMNKLKERVLNDPRVWYVIFNRRIWENGIWADYYGDNPHEHHMHISMKQNPASYDNPADWSIMDFEMVDPKIRAKRIGDIYKAATGQDISQKDLDFYISRPEGEFDLIYALFPQFQKYRDIIKLLEDDRDANLYPELTLLRQQVDELAKRPTAEGLNQLQKAIQELQAKYNKLKDQEESDKEAGESLLRRIGQLFKRFWS